jgi:hypothetical protein
MLGMGLASTREQLGCPAALAAGAIPSAHQSVAGGWVASLTCRRIRGSVLATRGAGIETARRVGEAVAWTDELESGELNALGAV